MKKWWVLPLIALLATINIFFVPSPAQAVNLDGSCQPGDIYQDEEFEYQCQNNQWCAAKCNFSIISSSHHWGMPGERTAYEQIGTLKCTTVTNRGVENLGMIYEEVSVEVLGVSERPVCQ